MQKEVDVVELDRWTKSKLSCRFNGTTVDVYVRHAAQGKLEATLTANCVSNSLQIAFSNNNGGDEFVEVRDGVVTAKSSGASYEGNQCFSPDTPTIDRMADALRTLPPEFQPHLEPVYRGDKPL